MLFLLALIVFLSLGGHRLLLLTLVETFDSIPLGGFHINDRVVTMLIALLQSMLSLALRVAAPVLCIIFLETVAMGFIARTVPQMNILSIGFAVRILIGVALLIGAIGVVTGVYIDAMQLMLKTVSGFFGTWGP